eukprot:6852824-Pyramimonas_sp.AAC.1
MYRVSNSDIRKRADIFSVSSTLLYRRLQWWRHVISPGLLPEPPDYDPTLAIRSVVFGKLSFEASRCRNHSCRIGQLLLDLRALWARIPAADKERAPSDSPC